jgi:hypothetical protein
MAVSTMYAFRFCIITKHFSSTSAFVLSTTAASAGAYLQQYVPHRQYRHARTPHRAAVVPSSAGYGRVGEILQLGDERLNSDTVLLGKHEIDEEMQVAKRVGVVQMKHIGDGVHHFQPQLTIFAAGWCRRSHIPLLFNRRL